MSSWIKLKFHSFFCLLSVSTCFGSEAPLSPSQKNSGVIKRAEQLFVEGHFNDAIPLYQQMLATSHPCRELALRLANCYLQTSHLEKAIDLLRVNAPHSSEWETDRVYLLGRVYRKCKRYQQAASLLDSLSGTIKKDPSPKIDFEKGLNLFHLTLFSEAKECFQRIGWMPTDPHLYYLSRLYLARIALLEKQSSKAFSILDNMELPADHPLCCEKAYLKGVACWLTYQYDSAITHLEEALPKKKEPACKWISSTHRCLISIYLHEANRCASNKEKASGYLQKALFLLQKTPADSADEIDSFLLGDFYILKGRLLKDPEAIESAKKIFSDPKLFYSDNTKLKAALKLADTIPNYHDRIEYFESLVNAYEGNAFVLTEILLHYGMNVLKEGVSTYVIDQSIHESIPLFNKAQGIFTEAFFSEASSRTNQNNQALKCFALAVLFNPSCLHLKESALFLKELMEDMPLSSNNPEKAEELYFLTGLIWKRLANKDQEAYLYAENIFNQLMDPSSTHGCSLSAAKALGRLYLERQEWQKAESIFSQLTEKQPGYIEAQLLLAVCAGELNQHDRKHFLMQAIFTNFSSSAMAPVAYFYAHNYREYLKGHRKAIKHLQSMPSLFPNHPLIINAHYIIGLDFLKDHLSAEGSILRRKDYIAAIDAFHKSEMAFDTLLKKQLISTAALPYFVHVRYRSTLEKGLANLRIAESSHGAKSRIYLEYAEEVFDQLICRLKKEDVLIRKLTEDNETFLNLLEECYYWLAKIRTKKNQINEANQTLDLALQLHNENAHLSKTASRDYFLSRIWYEKGKIAQKLENYPQAIHCFSKAEEVGLESLCLSPDQKLDLWIEKSLSYKEVGDLENAMLLLSKAVNDEAISSLRVKAMFLRAELYRLQGRPELALKQLEAVAKKGGEWGKLAKDKLEEAYGY